MKAIEQFCDKFGIRFITPEPLVLRAIGKNLHLFTPDQARQVDSHQPIVGGGILLGSIVKSDFVPSAQFIDLFLKDVKQVITLDDKTAWLYLCGRDVIETSTAKVNVPVGTFVVLKDRTNQLLGYGVVCDPRKKHGILVQNLYDKGSLLRREMTK